MKSMAENFCYRISTCLSGTVADLDLLGILGGHVFWEGFSITVLYEPRYEKTGFLHMRKQRRRSASR